MDAYKLLWILLIACSVRSSHELINSLGASDYGYLPVTDNGPDYGALFYLYYETPALNLNSKAPIFVWLQVGLCSPLLLSKNLSL